MKNPKIAELLFLMDKIDAGDTDYKINESKAYAAAAAEVWSCLNGLQREVLTHLLFQGPVCDGYIISKQARGDLFGWKLATRCCFMGEQGYTAATYRAFTIFDAGGGVPIAKKPGTQ